MSLQALGIGVSALLSSQRAMEVVAHNLANVNTDGYSRQRAFLTTNPPRPGVPGARGSGMIGMGVKVGEIQRLRNEVANAAFRAEASNHADWDVKADVMAKAENILGPIDGGTTKALSSFWAAWDQLSLYPDSLATRRGVLDAGKEVARWLNGGASQLQALVADSQAQLEDTVAEVNRLAAQLGSLNAAVRDALMMQNAPNDLLDQRDRLLDRVTSLTGGRIRMDDEGLAYVWVGNHALVQGEIVETMSISGLTPLAATWDADGLPVVPGGRMGGLIESANVLIPGFAAELNTIAEGLRDTVNAAHMAGFDQDGNPGAAFFTGTGAAGISVDPLLDTRGVAASATAAGAPNDGNNAIAIAGLRSAAAVGPDTVGGALAGLAARLGSTAAATRNNAVAAETVTAQLTRERAEESSVSTDEELADMIKFQRSYEAAARVITTVDEMLDVLVNRTGLVGR